MSISKPEDFYAAWAGERTYAKAELKAKHRRQFDRQFWRPAECRPHMSVLEVGCGTGLFLAYLAEKGITDFTGVDQEPRVIEHMPAELARHVQLATIGDFLKNNPERFHRIVLFDVFEHFSPIEGVALLEELRRALEPDGRIVLRLPNMSSPWGLRHQYGDLTHQAAYTPESIAQAAVAAGLEVAACLAVRRGSPFKVFSQRCLERLAGWLVADGPDMWSAVFVAVLKVRSSPY